MASPRIRVGAPACPCRLRSDPWENTRPGQFKPEPELPGQHVAAGPSSRVGSRNQWVAVNSPTALPSASANMPEKPTPGISILGMRVLPPRDSALASIASMSSTMM